MDKPTFEAKVDLASDVLVAGGRLFVTKTGLVIVELTVDQHIAQAALKQAAIEVLKAKLPKRGAAW